jgi:hypothetical protein
MVVMPGRLLCPIFVASSSLQDAALSLSSTYNQVRLRTRVRVGLLVFASMGLRIRPGIDSL